MRAGARPTRHIRRHIRRLTLAAIAACCLLPASAHAVDLPGGAAATGAANQVAQRVAAAPSAVGQVPATVEAAQRAVGQTASGAAGSAQPAVEQVAQTAATAGGAAKPAVNAAVDTVEGATTTAAPTEPAEHAEQAALHPPGGPERDVHRRAARSGQAHRGVERTPKQAAHSPSRAGGGQHVASSPSLASQAGPADAAKRPGADSSASTPSSPDQSFAPEAGSAASGISTGLGLGGLALLIAALVLAGPAIARRLKDAEAALRPTLFVSALERPG